MRDLHIIKVGGNVLKDEVILSETLKSLADLNQDIILVHGGGKHVDHWMAKLGKQPTMIDGRRITDALSLELAVMNYAGLINKSLVGVFQSFKKKALGLSGVDLGCITSVKRKHASIDYGYVGDVVQVNHEVFQWLLQHNVIPVCCAITADQQGQLLNTNADTIAAEIAKALAISYRVHLWYCFEKKGVLNDIEDEQSVIPLLTRSRYQEMLDKKIIHTGMLPKLKNCFDALAAGVQAVYITDHLGIRKIPLPSGTKIFEQ